MSFGEIKDYHLIKGISEKRRNRYELTLASLIDMDLHLG